MSEIPFPASVRWCRVPAPAWTPHEEPPILRTNPQSCAPQPQPSPCAASPQTTLYLHHTGTLTVVGPQYLASDLVTSLRAVHPRAHVPVLVRSHPSTRPAFSSLWVRPPTLVLHLPLPLSRLAETYPCLTQRSRPPSLLCRLLVASLTLVACPVSCFCCQTLKRL